MSRDNHYSTRSSLTPKVLFPEAHSAPEKTGELTTTQKRKFDSNTTTTTTASAKQTLSIKQSKSTELNDVKGTKLVSADMLVNGKYQRSVEEYRERLKNALAPYPIAEKVNITWRTLLYQNHSFNATIFIPPNLKHAPYPTLIYAPGTGFVANPNQFSEMVDSLTAKHGLCQVIFIEEKVAPENKYPTALNELIAFFKYIFDPESNDLNIDRNKVAAAGYCSGATLLVLAIMELEKESRNQYPIQHLFLLSPFVDLSRSLTQLDAYKYCKENEDQDTVVLKPYVEWLVEQYIPDSINLLEATHRTHALKNPALSPYYANDSDLALLPDASLLCGTEDRFFSDTIAFSQRLKNVNSASKTSKASKIQLYIAKDQNHGYAWNNKALIEFMAKMIKPIFSKKIAPLLALLSAAQVINVLLSPQPKRNQNESISYPEILNEILYNYQVGWEQRTLTHAQKSLSVIVSQLLSANEINFIENRLIEILTPYMNAYRSLDYYIKVDESKSTTLTQGTESKYRIFVVTSLLKKYYEQTHIPNQVNNDVLSQASDTETPNSSPNNYSQENPDSTMSISSKH